MSWLSWSPDWSQIMFLLKLGWYDITGTDFSQIRYTDIELALYAGAVIVCALLLKWLLPKLLFYLFGRNRTQYSQKVSGHLISEEYEKGYFLRIFLFLPKLAWVIPLIAILLAIAGPFVAASREEKKYIETRVRVDIRDVSGSMGFLFKGTNKSKAEIAANAHLEFLRMRAGKGDRTSFWLFSNNPYLIQSFTVDEEVYYQQVYDAPWEVGGTDMNKYWSDEQWGNYPIPKSRYAFAVGEGGTVMSTALRAVAGQFEDDDKRQKRSPFYRSVGKAVLILTDSEISDFEAARHYVNELRKKRVVIYVILIGEAVQGGDDEQSNNAVPILQEIQKNGGRFFPVSSQDSILNAYREIDRLEKSKIQIEKIIFKIPLFHKFLFIAILALICIIPLGLLFQLFDHP